jgi:hypothetical protein
MNTVQPQAFGRPADPNEQSAEHKVEQPDRESVDASTTTRPRARRFDF